MSRIPFVICAVLVVALATGTILRNRVWTQEVWLFEDAVQGSPEKPRAHVNIGMLYRNRGLLNKAQEHFKIAEHLHRQRREWDVLANAQNTGAVALSNLAALHMDYGGEGLWPEAERLLTRARNEYPISELVLANSIELMIRFDEVERAEHFAHAALREVPRSAILHIQLADVYAVMGNCFLREIMLARADFLDPLIQIDGVMKSRECQEVQL